MSIKIHHGAPGSFKTSGAVMDDFIPAVLAGRTIVTNVRGLSDAEKVRDTLEAKGKKVPESFALYFYDTTESENMEKIRTFFHWAPSGVFFLLDEIQEIYPKSISVQKLSQFDYPGGLDAASAEGTVPTLMLAFEKHRHRNWDFVVTTPNINKVHSVVRDSAEGAYKHRNLATMGRIFAGTYVEGFHMADSNGKASDFFTVQNKRIKKYVFDLYQSTQTGVATDTLAGNSIFKDPKMLLLFGVLGLCLFFVFSMGSPEIVAAQDENYKNEKLGIDPEVVQPDSKSGLVVSEASAGIAAPAGVNGTQSAGFRVADVEPVPVDTMAGYPRIIKSMLKAATIRIVSSYTFGGVPRFTLRFSYPSGYFDFDNNQLRNHGLRVSYITKCYIELTYQETTKFVHCQSPNLPAPGTQLAESIFTTPAFTPLNENADTGTAKPVEQ